jgi:hypothetical protein
VTGLSSWNNCAADCAALSVREHFGIFSQEWQLHIQRAAIHKYVRAIV